MLLEAWVCGSYINTSLRLRVVVLSRSQPVSLAQCQMFYIRSYLCGIYLSNPRQISCHLMPIRVPKHSPFHSQKQQQQPFSTNVWNFLGHQYHFFHSFSSTTPWYAHPEVYKLYIHAHIHRWPTINPTPVSHLPQQILIHSLPLSVIHHLHLSNVHVFRRHYNHYTELGKRLVKIL